MSVYIIKHNGATPIQRFLKRLTEGEHLNGDESAEMMNIILNGGATQGQIGALLTALRMKGETPEELAGAARTLIAKAERFEAPEDAADNCGTGGDGSHSFNISTAAAFIASASGVPIVKHGNRSVSSRSGSADVLEACGVNINAPAYVQQKALGEAGICFLMAPLYHKTMRQVAPVRKELCIRTLFNMLGPALNPAQVNYQLVGVYSQEMMRPMAELLRDIGRARAWVVHSRDGMDEISPCDVTDVMILDEEGGIKPTHIAPEDYFGKRFHPAELSGGDARQNAQALKEVLQGKGTDAYRAAALMNAAGTVCAAGMVDTFADGLEVATEALDSGTARDVLTLLAEITSSGAEE